MDNFWLKLKNSRQKAGQAIYALAPMAGITDSAWRQICKEFGADVVYSEMASATALAYNSGKTLEMLKFSPKERPYAVQLFGSNPEHFAKAVKLIEEKIKPDGIDINFGCPVPKIAKQKAGAELFKDLKLSREILKVVIANTTLPVSIKTRTKVGSVDILQFLEYVRGLDIKAIMVHGRTFSQGFSGPVDFKIIKKARKYFSGVILANGGVVDRQTAQDLLEKSGADGVGIGQGALGRPWIFCELKAKSEKVKTKGEIFEIILKQAKLAYKLKGRQGIVEMRKHLCWYVQGLSGARKLREKLVKVESLDDIKRILISKTKN
ncbi:MAG: tRNA-dihydrouridine synthase [Patescibacteria group bacterium]|nr:tRNA-dihydrouridine synthase [Patescibacteria group bacterium]